MHYMVDKNKHLRRLNSGTRRIEDLIEELGMMYFYFTTIPGEVKRDLDESVEKLRYVSSRLNELMEYIDENSLKETVNG